MAKKELNQEKENIQNVSKKTNFVLLEQKEILKLPEKELIAYAKSVNDAWLPLTKVDWVAKSPEEKKEFKNLQNHQADLHKNMELRKNLKAKIDPIEHTLNFVKVSEKSKAKTEKTVPTIEKTNAKEESAITTEKNKNVKMSSATTGEEKKEIKNEKVKAKSENLDYLLDKLKYLGFPKNDYIKEKIQDIMDSGKGGTFKHYAKNDSTIGQNNVTFDVKINHSEKNNKFYFGGYDAKLENLNKGIQRELSMTSSANTYTAKEAVNLLEGRMVKREFENKSKGFVGLDFNSPKNEYGNHKLKIVNQKDKLDVAKVVGNSAVVLKDSAKYSKEKLSEFLTKSLEKGNLVKTQIDTKEGIKDGFVRYDAINGDLKYHDDKYKSIPENDLNLSAAKGENKTLAQEEVQTASVKR